MDIELTQMLKSEKPRVTAGKLVFVYILAGLVGTVYETLLNLFRGDGFVACNGSLFTLFNPVYGVGGVMIVLAMGTYRKPIVIFGIGAVTGATVEYILSFLEEAIMGTRSWDYSDLPLNIDGRTTLLLAGLWGGLSVAVILLAYVPFSKLLDKLPRRMFRVASAFFLAVVLLDSSFTVTALFRYTDRMNGVLADSRIELFLDHYFDDEFMSRLFPQMKPADQKRAPSGRPEAAVLGSGSTDANKPRPAAESRNVAQNEKRYFAIPFRPTSGAWHAAAG